MNDASDELTVWDALLAYFLVTYTQARGGDVVDTPVDTAHHYGLGVSDDGCPTFRGQPC